MEIKKLYVDSLNPDKTIGVTDDPKTIAYNISQMGETLRERFANVLTENNEAGSIGPIGRYIFTFSISLEDKIYQMAFVDLKNNAVEAKKIALKYQDKNDQEIVMEQFYILSKTYEQDYDSFVLVAGKPPVQ